MKTESNFCNLCNGILDIILKDHEGVSPRVASSEALGELEELLGDKDCWQSLICLPRIRLSQNNSLKERF